MLHRFLPGNSASFDSRGFSSACAGFTLLEILAVLVILGVFGVIAATRFTGTDAAAKNAAASLKAHLRYAHLRAMGDTVSWGIHIRQNSYTLLKNGNPAAINLPGETGPTKNLRGAQINPQERIHFSPGRGVPEDAGGTPLAGSRIFAIGQQTVTVTRTTGFVP